MQRLVVDPTDGEEPFRLKQMHINVQPRVMEFLELTVEFSWEGGMWGWGGGSKDQYDLSGMKERF